MAGLVMLLTSHWAGASRPVSLPVATPRLGDANGNTADGSAALTDVTTGSNNTATAPAARVSTGPPSAGAGLGGVAKLRQESDEFRALVGFTVGRGDRAEERGVE